MMMMRFGVPTKAITKRNTKYTGGYYIHIRDCRFTGPPLVSAVCIWQA
jgi:hypothetical protein